MDGLEKENQSMSLDSTPEDDSMSASPYNYEADNKDLQE